MATKIKNFAFRPYLKEIITPAKNYKYSELPENAEFGETTKITIERKANSPYDCIDVGYGSITINNNGNGINDAYFDYPGGHYFKYYKKDNEVVLYGEGGTLTSIGGFSEQNVQQIEEILTKIAIRAGKFIIGGTGSANYLDKFNISLPMKRENLGYRFKGVDKKEHILTIDHEDPYVPTSVEELMNQKQSIPEYETEIFKKGDYSFSEANRIKNFPWNQKNGFDNYSTINLTDYPIFINEQNGTCMAVLVKAGNGARINYKKFGDNYKSMAKNVYDSTGNMYVSTSSWHTSILNIITQIGAQEKEITFSSDNEANENIVEALQNVKMHFNNDIEINDRFFIKNQEIAEKIPTEYQLLEIEKQIAKNNHNKVGFTFNMSGVNVLNFYLSYYYAEWLIENDYYPFLINSTNNKIYHLSKFDKANETIEFQSGIDSTDGKITIIKLEGSEGQTTRTSANITVTLA